MSEYMIYYTSYNELGLLNAGSIISEMDKITSNSLHKLEDDLKDEIIKNNSYIKKSELVVILHSVIKLEE